LIVISSIVLTFKYLSYSLLFKIETHLSISLTNSFMSFLPSSNSPSLSSALTIVLLFILSQRQILLIQRLVRFGEPLVFLCQLILFINQFPQFQFDFGYYDAQVGHVAIGLGIVPQKYAILRYYALFHEKNFLIVSDIAENVLLLSH